MDSVDAPLNDADDWLPTSWIDHPQPHTSWLTQAVRQGNDTNVVNQYVESDIHVIRIRALCRVCGANGGRHEHIIKPVASSDVHKQLASG